MYVFLLFIEDTVAGYGKELTKRIEFIWTYPGLKTEIQCRETMLHCEWIQKSKKLFLNDINFVD